MTEIMEDVIYKKPNEGCGLIYYYLFDDGKGYIGQTVGPMIKRHNGHKRGTQIVDRYIRTHDFVLTIIEEVEYDRLNERELFNILKYNTYTPTGLNMTLDTISNPEYVSHLWKNEEYRNLQSKVHKEWHLTHQHPNLGKPNIIHNKQEWIEKRKGKIPWNKGLKGHLSQDTLDKISAKSKEMWASDDFRKRKQGYWIRKKNEGYVGFMLGFKHDEETKRVMSVKKTELWKNEEYRNHQSKVHKEWYLTHQHHQKGKPMSDEAKLKSSISHKEYYKLHPQVGRPHTEEEKAKMRKIKAQKREEKLQRFIDWEWEQVHRKDNNEIHCQL